MLQALQVLQVLQALQVLQVLQVSQQRVYFPSFAPAVAMQASSWLGAGTGAGEAALLLLLLLLLLVLVLVLLPEAWLGMVHVPQALLPEQEQKQEE